MGLEFEAVGAGENGHLRLVPARGEDPADLRDGDVGDGARNFCGGRCGEEEFVVFAAVEERGELGAVVECGGEGMDGEGGEFEFGRDLGGGAEMGEVGGETVAEIDAGGGEGRRRRAWPTARRGCGKRCG